MSTRKKIEKPEQERQTALSDPSHRPGAALPRLLTIKPQSYSNALRHGLTGQSVYLTPSELRDYVSTGAMFINELRPITISQMHLAQRIFDTEWRLNTAVALSTLVHNANVDLELQAMYQADPSLACAKPCSVEVDNTRAKAQVGALRRQCEGPNTLDKLGRHEIRLERSLRSLRQEYRDSYRRTRYELKQAWDPEKNYCYTWYRDLKDLADQLLEARKELLEKTVEEIVPQSLTGLPLATSATDNEQTSSAQNLFCKMVLRLLGPLSPKTANVITKALDCGLLTEAEETLFPLPDSALSLRPPRSPDAV